MGDHQHFNRPTAPLNDVFHMSNGKVAHDLPYGCMMSTLSQEHCAKLGTIHQHHQRTVFYSHHQRSVYPCGVIPKDAGERLLFVKLCGVMVPRKKWSGSWRNGTRRMKRKCVHAMQNIDANTTTDKERKARATAVQQYTIVQACMEYPT